MTPGCQGQEWMHWLRVVTFSLDGPLVKTVMSVLKPEASDSLRATSFDIWKFEVKVKSPHQSAV